MWRSDFARKLMSNTAAQALNFGSRWLLNLAVARHLSEHEFGVFSLIYMVANLLFPTLAFGSNFFLIHETAKHRDIRQLVSSFALTACVSLVVLAGVGLYQWLAAEPLPLFLYLLAALVGLLWALAQQCYSYLKGAQQFHAEMHGQFLSAILMLIVAVLVIMGVFATTQEVMLAIVGASLVPVIHGLKWLWPEIQQAHGAQQRPLLSVAMVKQRLSYAWHDVFAIYLSNIPFVFLSMFSTLIALGMFRKSFVLFMPVTLLPVVFSHVLLARLSGIVDAKARLAQFKRLFVFTFPLLSAPYLGLALLNPWLYPLLLNEPLQPIVAEICHWVVSTLWLTLLKSYVEVWLTSLGYNHWRAMVVSAVAVGSSVVYIAFNQQLSAQMAAWIFFAGNLVAVVAIALCGLPAYRRYAANALQSG